MNPSRRRKKRPNYGIRTVEVMRGPNGFGFTISGQQPCILSCIVSNSPADLAGLRAGNFLISVNGVSVSKIAHDAIVSRIGNCVGPIKMTVADNYYSDSSDEELDCGRIVNSRKPKYMHKPRARIQKTDLRRTAVETNEKNFLKMRECISKQITNETRNIFSEDPNRNVEKPINIANNAMSIEDEAGPIEYKALVGYLGTIEMPKELLPSSRLQTVCSCIRKLRQEKRRANAVLMTILPTCLTLKDASNHILAIYPTNRVVYIGSVADRESRYFGLVTSAVCDRRTDSLDKRFTNNSWYQEEKQNNNVIDNDNGIDISNSCHVFVTDPKITDHNIHQKKAEKFNILCTTDAVTGNCLEFPPTALYIVSLVQNLYKLQTNDKNNENAGPLIANSPQPSASSNSDSGIGYRDDCGNISDRILVVEFPSHNPMPYLRTNNRPSGIDATGMALEGLDEPIKNNQSRNFELNNARQIMIPKNDAKNSDLKQLNNLNNIRACEGIHIKNSVEKVTFKNDLTKQHNNVDLVEDYSKLNCRAMPNVSVKSSKIMCDSENSDDNTKSLDLECEPTFQERPVDVPDVSPSKKSCESLSLHSVNDNSISKNSVDNVSVHSSKSIEFTNFFNVFKIPFETKKHKRQIKTSSCDNLDKYNENFTNYKLSPKVYGLSKPNYGSEELVNFDSGEKFGYGSLQDLCRWTDQNQARRTIAQSEPDVRHPRNCDDDLSEQNGVAKYGSSEGPAAWAYSFEKLLEDPLGLLIFAEFLKKEFSAENIYFWAACERFRNLPPGSERTAEAQRIYRQHLNVGAPEAVNVDAQGRQCTEQSLKEPNSDIFEQPQKQIFNLMKFDSYPRFLKSEIYKHCLSGNFENPPSDPRLLLHIPVTTPSKLKKSVSNAEDRRRKSLLPWHRKNRSKSKDRGEIEYSHKRLDDEDCCVNTIEKNKQCDVHSSGSSLTSLDLAVTCQESAKMKVNNNEDLTLKSDRTALCRVILTNGYTTVVQIKESESIQELITRVLDKRGLTYSCFEVFTDKHPKPLDVNDSSTKLAGCEVNVEQRVVFKVDLPNRKTINIKSKSTKIIIEVLRPSLHKYQFNLDQVIVLNGNRPVDLHLAVTSINGLRLNVQLKEEFKQECPMFEVRAMTNKRDELTNKIFEGIIQEKANSATFKPKESDKGSVKSEDWGSEHSSTFIGKFLRRDSGIHDKKKKLVQRCKGINEDNAMGMNQTKKPLIAKWKTGVNKLNISSLENDELVEGLTRAQRRLEDQRGTEINFELPDFLKDKENHPSSQNPHRQTPKLSDLETNTRFHLDCTEIQSEKSPVTIPVNSKRDVSAYENRSIIAPLEYNQSSSLKMNARKLPLLSSPDTSSNQSSPGCVNTTVIENKTQGRLSDPPPLPPKPKIIPIKPPNWGQLNGFHKKATDRTQAMFLEQPSSSFV